MVECIYNNIKSFNNKYCFFKLNYTYYLHFLYKKDINSYFLSKLEGKLLTELQELITFC